MPRFQMCDFTGVFKCLVGAGLLTLCVIDSGRAADITWNGTYRVEGVKVNSPELNSDKADKAYVLHHLVLRPKLIAADSLTLYARLDILNHPTLGIAADGQVHSVAGDTIGNGPATSPAPVRGTDSNSWGRTQRASMVAVTALYGSWAHEFGQFLVGRMPLQFGLGTAYNAGNGSFDHYIDTRDVVAYRMNLGNFYITPIMGKVNEGELGYEDDVDDYIFQLEYINHDTELQLGFLYNIRVAMGNDAPVSSAAATSYWGGAYTRSGTYKNNLMSFFFSQKPASWLRAKLEADVLSGDTGVINNQNKGVGLNAFGVAGEFEYLGSADSKWGSMFKFGLATGDDPDTNDIYEGFAFNRNYDVAMLMFNHPLGAPGSDILRTGLVRDTTGRPSNQIDSEAISNVLYFAPSISYRSKPNLSYGTTLIYGILNKDPFIGDVGAGRSLGYELDFSVSYKPVERMTWITEAAVLFPGDAWKGGTNAYETKTAYGIITKAAINF